MLRIHRALLLIVCSGLLAGTAAAEKIVIPVFLRSESTALEWGLLAGVVNGSDEPVRIEGERFAFLLECPIPEGCPEAELPPKTAAPIVGPDAPSGLVLDVPDPRDVFTTVRVTRSPLGPKVAGAALPIARESDFTDRPLIFPLVPLGNAPERAVRVHLRIYSLSEEPPLVRVETRGFYAELSAPPLDAAEFHLLPQAAPAPSHFLFVDLVAHLPAAISGGHQTITVLPLPGQDGLTPKIWAFISLTSPSDEISTLQP